MQHFSTRVGLLQYKNTSKNSWKQNTFFLCTHHSAFHNVLRDHKYFIIIIIYLPWSWATCWPVPVSTYPEVSSKVCHDSFCQLGNSVSLPWVIYYGAFYLHVVSSFSGIPIICLKLVLFLIPLQFVYLFCNQSKCITNIYNKKTTGPTLMELFTATGKLKKYIFENQRCSLGSWGGVVVKALRY